MIVSILIPLKTDTSYLNECIQSCLNSVYQDFEIIVLPDKSIELNYPKTKIIPTGEVTPPVKRDIGIKEAKGEIVAFIDDDVIVKSDWLSNALKNFSDQDIAAVGGPAITAEKDSFLQKASGKVYESLLVSGNFRYRYLALAKRLVDDYPSCNFLVRKQTLNQVGGFKTNFWPGEDTFLCLEITHKLNKKIVYDPQVLVFHHRRPLFKPHLAQISNYALHRGYFVKRFPKNSLKVAYFLPSLLVLWLIFGWLLLPQLYLGSLFLYLIACLIVSLQKDLRLTPYLFGGIILTHLVYGFSFLRGLFSRRLSDE